jgi:phage tail tape-measure protein
MSVFEAVHGRGWRAGSSARWLRPAGQMSSPCRPMPRLAGGLMLSGLLLLGAGSAAAQSAAATIVYRCPGNPVLYTDALTPQEARERGCTTIEGAPVTVVQTRRPQPPAAAPAQAGGAAARDAQARVDPAAQRARDTDARRILGAELQREQARLAELQREYNNGEPERRGDERNYQRYLDRVADLRVNIARQQANIAALQRELSRLPQ